MTGAALPLLLYAAVAVPLAAALMSLVPGWRHWQMAVLPWVPLPALLAALLVPEGTVAPLPGVLLGSGLMFDTLARLFLGFSAFLWMAAGAHAARTLADRPAPFAGFWLLTLSGNMLAVLAADVVAFYMGFAALSLAAWGLVIHSGTPEARRAGRVYIRLAVLGESLLVMAMMLGAATAGSVVIGDVSAALATAPDRGLAVGLLIAGFGIKAGLMPLHVWLPLAHPAAPVPASAVLSGAIVKAGILGLLRFLPFDAAMADWGAVLVAAGFFTALVGAILGMMQTRPKTALAYSTLSQMGLVCAAIGVGLAAPLDAGARAALFGAVALYIVHHGLAKGALFLAVDAVPAGPWWARAAGFLTALAIAGLPLTGGALAKAVLKAGLGSGAVVWLATFSAVATTILMLHAVRLIANSPAKGAPPPRLPFAVLALAAPVAGWAVASTLDPAAAAAALAPAKLFDALWPVALGAAIWAAAARWQWRWSWRAPEGDLVVAYERLGARVAALVSSAASVRLRKARAGRG